MDNSLPPREQSGFELQAAVLHLLGHAWTLAVVPFLVGVATAGLMLVWPKAYTSTASLIPEGGGVGGGLSELLGAASQIGLLGGTGIEPSRSSLFYADLLTSRPIVYGVLETRVAGPNGAVAGAPGDSTELLDVLGVSGRTLPERLDKGYRKLLPRLVVDTDRRTGIVRLSVTARGPALAAEIADAELRQLAQFNGTSRQSQARARRTFAEKRAVESVAELTSLENSLRQFYERNRSWRGSPTLVLEEQRLQRQIAVQQEVYLTLRREVETARIAEVNDLPVFTVIERPAPPIRHSKPHRVAVVLYAVAGSWLLTALAVLVREGGWGALGLDPAFVTRLRAQLQRLWRRSPASR